MNFISRTITGVAMILGGLLIIGFSFSFGKVVFWVPLIYGIPLLTIGAYLLFNKNEDKIEEIKHFKMKGGKK